MVTTPSSPPASGAATASSNGTSPGTAPVAVRIVAVPELVRAGVTAVLQRSGDQVVVVDEDTALAPDVVLFDPDYAVNGAAAGVRVGSTVALVAITTRDCPLLRERARAMGAVLLVPIRVQSEELVGALVQARATTRMQTLPYSELSGREASVLSLICRGLSNDEIGQELHLSGNTVKTYIRATYRKIGVQRRSQAVLWGLARGY